MLKISEVGASDGNATLKLEGRLVGPWVRELRRICEPFLTLQSPLTLDLADVSFVDEDGLAALNDLKIRGAQLGNYSPFVEEQLKGVPR